MRFQSITIYRQIRRRIFCDGGLSNQNPGGKNRKDKQNEDDEDDSFETRFFHISLPFRMLPFKGYIVMISYLQPDRKRLSPIIRFTTF
jgi:hypothetical protein